MQNFFKMRLRIFALAFIHLAIITCVKIGLRCDMDMFIKQIALIGFFCLIVMTDYAADFFLAYGSDSFRPRIRLLYRLADKNLERRIGKVLPHILALSVLFILLFLLRSHISGIASFSIKGSLIFIFAFFIKITWVYHMHDEKYKIRNFCGQIKAERGFEVISCYLPYCAHALFTYQFVISDYGMANTVITGHMLFFLYPFAQVLANYSYKLTLAAKPWT